MEIVETQKDDISIMKILGRLDSNTSPDLEEKIGAAVDNGALKLVLDFESLEYISSAGLRVILKTTKSLKRSEGKLILCAMQDYVKEVFEISGFDTFLPIVATLDDAVSSF
jgi:anti-sigma B factor antagonist